MLRAALTSRTRRRAEHRHSNLSRFVCFRSPPPHVPATTRRCDASRPQLRALKPVSRRRPPLRETGNPVLSCGHTVTSRKPLFMG